VAESDKDMNERIVDDFFHDLQRDWRVIPPIIEPMPEWVIQPKHPVGFQLLRMRGNREPGPRLEFTIRLTLGREASPEEAQDMLETIKDMFRETFVASVDFVDVEPLLSPQLRRPI
jgi:hypothetical protein